MVDIRSEKWLWIKGGLFVVISLLSIALLLMELSSPRQVVLVFVSIWACCRAYYFAFYVIEKYIDSRFRFAGLLYLPQYMWQRQQGLSPTEPTQASESRPLSWYLFWPCVFVVGNFIEPSFYSLIHRAGFDRGEELIAAAIAGALSTQIVFAAVASSSLRVPFKIALPCSVGFLWFLTATFFIGCVFMGLGFEREWSVLVCLFSPILYLFTLGFLNFLLSMLRLEWRDAWQLNSVPSIRKKQLSIRYLLIATTVAAILCVTIKVSGIAIGFLTQNGFDEVSTALVFGSTPFICLFLLLLLAILAAPSLKKGRMLYGAIAVLVATLPFILHELMRLAFLLLGKTFPTITLLEVRYWYCFLGGFAVSLLVILLHARKQGLRLVFSESATASLDTV